MSWVHIPKTRTYRRETKRVSEPDSVRVNFSIYGTPQMLRRCEDAVKIEPREPFDADASNRPRAAERVRLGPGLERESSYVVRPNRYA